jgi:signal-transduction protein with cAMP-binding, CBS, and nucleotidyltransferase domain
VTDVVAVSPEETTAVAAQQMREKSVGSLVVTVDDLVKGILTDRDLLACIAEAHDPKQCNVARHMTSSVTVAGPDEELFMAAEIMADKKIKRLPIVEQGKLVGLVSFSDIADVVSYEWQHVWWRVAPLTRLLRAEAIYRRGRKPHPLPTTEHPLTGL